MSDGTASAGEESLRHLRSLAASRDRPLLARVDTFRERSDWLDAACSTIALDDASADEKVLALLALRGEVGNGRVLEALTSATRSPTSRVRALAVASLGPWPHADVWDALVVALDDADAAVRGQAIEALTQCDDDRLAMLLLERFDDADPQERVAAVSLGSAKGLSGWEAMVQPAAADPSPLVRVAAIRAAADLASWESVIVEALSDADVDVRVAAVTATRQARAISTDSISSVVLDPAPAVRIAAIAALNHRGDATACGSIAACLDDPVPQVASVAILALGQLGCQSYRADLVARFGRESDDARAAVLIRAITELDPRDHVVQDSLGHRSAAVRRAVIGALPDPVPPGLVAPLAQSLRVDNDAIVRRYAAERVTATSSAVREHLATAVRSDPSPAVRLAALRRFSASSSPQHGYEVARVALDDPDSEVRAQAVTTLADIGPEFDADPDKTRSQLRARLDVEDELRVRAAMSRTLALLDAEGASAAWRNAPEVRLFDPCEKEATYTQWWPDIDATVAGAHIGFSSIGQLEVVADDGISHTWKYRVAGNQLTVTQPTGEAVLSFVIDHAVAASTQSGKQLVLSLTLSKDLLFGSEHALSLQTNCNSS